MCQFPGLLCVAACCSVLQCASECYYPNVTYRDCLRFQCALSMCVYMMCSMIYWVWKTKISYHTHIHTHTHTHVQYIYTAHIHSANRVVSAHAYICKCSTRVGKWLRCWCIVQTMAFSFVGVAIGMPMSVSVSVKPVCSKHELMYPGVIVCVCGHTRLFCKRNLQF